MKHIALNIDSNYVSYCSILIKSILKYNQGITFHILHNGLKDKEKNIIERRIDIDSINKVFFYLVDSSHFKNMPKSIQWPEAIYYRLIIPQLLGENIKKVLYLDCDIMVRGSLNELFETNLSSFGIAAVEDVLSPISPMIEALGADPTFGYFNSGVLLINLEYWKENAITEKTLDFINDNLDVIQHPDQDALNYVLNKNWKKIHSKWNFLRGFQDRYYSKEHLLKDSNKESINYPIILHFSGVKPWSSRCRSIYKFEYHEIMREAGFENLIPNLDLKDHAEELVVRFLHKNKMRWCKTNYYV
jgi:lipopolysaccharide biosynthesis glycosyltransferase